MARKKKATSRFTDEQKRILSAVRAHLPVVISEDPASRYGVHGLGIGEKFVKGKKTDIISLRFYVECKLSPEQLSPERKIPNYVHIPMTPTHTLEVPTDVIVMSRPRITMQDPESVLRPVPGGASISVPGSGGSGTLGAWVLDKTDDTVVALSNRHVLGQTNNAVVIQPGSNDGGSAPGDRIGTVKRHVEFNLTTPTSPTDPNCNLVDAAIMMADDPDLIDLTVIDVGPGIYTIDTVQIGDPVQKTGQTTGYTTGTIFDADFSALQFAEPITPGNFQDVVFCQCILVEKDNNIPPPGFSSFGDSGAVLFGFAAEQDAVIHPAVGLIFAEGNGMTVACKIQNVFNALNLDVLCSSGYPAYLDSMAENANNSERTSVATRFTVAERLTHAATRRSSGLARDVERRLKVSKKGQELVDLVRRFRHPIFAQLIRQSDLRRAATEALKPVLTGTVTSDDVLNYEIDHDDLERIHRVIKVLQNEGMEDIAKALKGLSFTRKKAKGKNLLELLDLDEHSYRSDCKK